MYKEERLFAGSTSHFYFFFIIIIFDVSTIIRPSNHFLSNPVLLHRGKSNKGPVDVAYATHQLLVWSPLVNLFCISPVDVIMYVLYGGKVGMILIGWYSFKGPKCLLWIKSRFKPHNTNNELFYDSLKILQGKPFKRDWVVEVVFLIQIFLGQPLQSLLSDDVMKNSLLELMGQVLMT